MKLARTFSAVQRTVRRTATRSFGAKAKTVLDGDNWNTESFTEGGSMAGAKMNMIYWGGGMSIALVALFVTGQSEPYYMKYTREQ